MADSNDRGREARRRRHAAIRAEVAEEEAEAAESEAAENRAALEIPMHLRIDKELDDYLRERAHRQGVAVSAVVRQMLRNAAEQGQEGVSPAEVEAIARRIAREELQQQ